MKYIIGFFVIVLGGIFLLKFASHNEVGNVYEARLKLFLTSYNENPEKTITALNSASKTCTEEKVGKAPEAVFPFLSQTVLKRAEFYHLPEEAFGKAVAESLIPYVDELEKTTLTYSPQDQEAAKKAVFFWQEDPVALVACQNARLRDTVFFGDIKH